MTVVEGARIPEVRLVEHRPQPRLDRDPDPGGRVPAGEVDAEAERGDDDDRREIGDEQRAVASVDRVVDGALDEDRDEQREQREHERAGEPDRDEPILRPPEREQVPDRRPESEIRGIDVRHGVLLAVSRARCRTGSRPARAGRKRLSGGPAPRAGRPQA